MTRVYPKEWSQTDVVAAAEQFKLERPDRWVEMEMIEKTTGDMTGTDASAALRGVLTRMHPEVPHWVITELIGAVRAWNQKRLGLR